MSQEPVVIPAIMLSDSVIREAGTHKVSLIGCFSVWNAPTLPFRAPPFFVTPFLTNFRSRNGTLEITVHIETTARHTLWSASAKIEFQTNEPTTPPDAMIEIPFRVNNVVYQQAGRYTIRVFVDSDEISSRDFVVQSITAPGITREGNKPS